jgi:hypothetical protein
MKTLKIYKTDEGEYALERINEFQNVTKRFCENQEELIDTLKAYPNLEDYDIQVNQSLWSVIINQLNK